MLLIEGLTILGFGVFVDMVMGDRAFYGKIPHPVVAMGSVVSSLDGLLNTARRRYGIERVGAFVVGDENLSGCVCKDKAMGFLSLFLMVLISLGVGWLVWMGLELLDSPLSWLLEGMIVGILVAGRSLHDYVQRVASACEEGNLERMQEELQHIVSRDTKRLDKWGVARGAFDSLSDNYVDGVLSPLFWWVVAGVPGMLVYKMVNTADSMIGYHAMPYRDYGYASARADDFMNFVTARIGAMVLLVSSLFVKGASFTGAWRSLRMGAWRNHRSASAGFPSAAFAGALGLRLGGKRVYPGEIVVESWIGEGRSKVNGADIQKGLMLYRWACFLHVAVLVLLWMGIDWMVLYFWGWV